MDQREGRQAEVGLGLAAAGREEEQVDNLAVVVVRIDDPGQVHQDEGKLERSPGRGIDRRLRPSPASDRTGAERPWPSTRLAIRKAISTFSSARASMPASIRFAAILARCNKASATSRAPGRQRRKDAGLLLDPFPVSRGERPECLLGGGRIGELSQRLHAKFDVRDRSRRDRARPRPRGSSTCGRVDSYPARRHQPGLQCRARRRTRKRPDTASQRRAGRGRCWRHIPVQRPVRGCQDGRRRVRATELPGWPER